MVCGKALTVGFLPKDCLHLRRINGCLWVGGGNLKKVEEFGIV
jgi:hypothetical protein